MARALDVAVEALARDGPERPAALALLLERLGRLGVAAQAEALDLLSQRFGAALDGARADRVALIGLRGAGKTTLGQRLAKEFGVPFIEMAREVERDSGLSLQELFDLSGQAAYRRYERRALGRVLESHSAVVIAAGGSIVSEPATYDRLLGACLTVWLRAAPEDHMGRVVAQGGHAAHGRQPGGHGGPGANPRGAGSALWQGGPGGRDLGPYARGKRGRSGGRGGFGARPGDRRRTCMIIPVAAARRAGED